DDGDSSVAKSQINFLCGVIVSNIVRVSFEIEFTDLLEQFAVIDFADTSVVIRNEDAVQLRDVGDSLRRAEANNGMDLLAFAQIEHFNRIVAERTNEQSFGGGIEREVIYSSFDSR